MVSGAASVTHRGLFNYVLYKINAMQYLCIIVTILSIHKSNCQSYTPVVSFEVYTPQGFDVSIPGK